MSFVSEAKSLISSDSSTPAKLIALLCSAAEVPATNFTIISRGTYSPSSMESIGVGLENGDGSTTGDGSGDTCVTGVSVALTIGSGVSVGAGVGSSITETEGSGVGVASLALAGAGTKRVTTRPIEVEIDRNLSACCGKARAFKECPLIRCRNATSLPTLGGTIP